MINLRETCVFPLETQGLYSTARVHNFFRPGRNGNSVGSEVTHRPMAAEINRCRLTCHHDWHRSWSHAVIAWASYQIRKLAGCACAGNAGSVFPATDFKGNRCLAIPTCITARESRTCRDACRDRYPPVAGKTFLSFPAHAQLSILPLFTYLARGPCSLGRGLGHQAPSH